MPIRFDIRKLAESSDIFVETGTLRGEGIACALAAGFNQVISIELSDEHFKFVDFMFGALVEHGVLTLLRGDCAELLPRVVSQLDAKGQIATFWLDANHETVLYPSLDAIANSRCKEHVILIDDVRIMGKAAPSVDLDVVMRRLRAINADYTISREMGVQPDDIILARPAQ